MKFTLNWLSQHLETTASLDEICDKLTMIGIEVEEVVDLGARYAPFKIVRLNRVEAHPKSKKLNLCYVSDGESEVITQIVCGAPNVYEGMLSVLAPIGAIIPTNQMKIERTLLAGEESAGMLCSQTELGIGLDADGIIDLEKDAPVGMLYKDYAKLDDALIEIKVTPNRGDALGVRGIARDLAAAGMGVLKPLDTNPIKGTFASDYSWAIAPENADKNACEMVVGRAFKGVKNGPSPEWLQRLLFLTGHRPISALVDITNFLTFDLGRPLHVYDCSKLNGKQLTMRLASSGEQLLALDGETYDLNPDITVIGDQAAPVGIGGIMGGELSGCDENTSEVFLEAAYFTPSKVAEQGRTLNLMSDARYRFERGIDPQSVEWGSEIATRMILEFCGGTCSELVRAGVPATPTPPITLRLARLSSYGGIEIDRKTVFKILSDLGCGIENKKADEISVTPPSWRSDLQYEVCLIEEVLRIHGYEHVPTCSMVRDPELPPPTSTLSLHQRFHATKILCGLGLDEIVSWSFLSQKQANLFGGFEPQMEIANPISSELKIMRTSLLPNLLQAVQKNAARGLYHSNLFEVAPVYHGVEPTDQAIHASGVRSGLRYRGKHWQADQTTIHYDLYDAKSDLYALLNAMGLPIGELELSTDVPDYYHPGQAANVLFDGRIVGRFGAFHPTILEAYDLRYPTVGFEGFLSDWPLLVEGDLSISRPPYYPATLQPVLRDFAFIVPEETPANSILNTIHKVDSSLIAEVKLFDIYRDPAKPQVKSLAIEVTLQPTENSLNDAELHALSNRIIECVETDFNAQLR